MAKFKATVAGTEDGFNLSFDDIKTKPGLYVRRDGRILINATKNAKLVDDQKVRTKVTRTGMLVLMPNGTLRKPCCDRNPDGVKQWKKFTGTVTIGG